MLSALVIIGSVSKLLSRRLDHKIASLRDQQLDISLESWITYPTIIPEARDQVTAKTHK